MRIKTKAAAIKTFGKDVLLFYFYLIKDIFPKNKVLVWFNVYSTFTGMLVCALTILDAECKILPDFVVWFIYKWVGAVMFIEGMNLN